MIRVLGPADVVDAAGIVHDVPGRRAQALLCRLTVDAGRVVSVDALIDALWPDGPVDGPAAALQTQVFRLRKRLAFPGAPTITTRPPGYVLELEAAGVDSTELERRIETATNSQPTIAVDELERALALWRGVPFAGLEDDETLRAEQIRLEELHAQAIEAHADALIATGRSDLAIARLESFLAEQPLRAHACESLMRAFAASGRAADAIRVFQEHRRRLVDELGLEPSPTLRRLEASIVRGEVGELDEASDATEPVTADHGAPTPTIDAMTVRVCTTPSMQLAWAELGGGSPVVVVPAWVSSLDVIASGRDPRATLIEGLARHHRVITYDRRGTGLSGGDVADFGVEAAVDELDAIAKLIGEPFAVVAMSGAGPIALAYAARRPELVSHLALFGTYASGPATFGDVGRPVLDLLRQRPSLGTELLAGLYRPGASPAATIQLAQALRDSAPMEVAAGYLQAIYTTDVADLVPRVRAPALVLHYRRDRVIPFSGGESLAAALPSVRFIAKDGNWHLPDSRDVASIVDAIEELLAV
jgi:DNA-binding SARP family transcriptional activator/pimeloyl-ACP methyl ester carboxylesterase